LQGMGKENGGKGGRIRGTETIKEKKKGGNG
jgi:hypothetical protein